MKYNKNNTLTYNILGDYMEIFLEILISIFFTFGIISFCEKLYYLFFDFKIKKYKKDTKSKVKLILEIDKYEDYIEELLKVLMYGEYSNLQNVVDKVEMIIPKKDEENIKKSKWFSNNYYLNVKK